MESRDNGERLGIDANHPVVLGRFAFPDRSGARPDRAHTYHGIDGPDWQHLDEPDFCCLGIGREQSAVVGVGYVDGIIGDHDPMRTEVQALSRDDMNVVGSIFTSQPV